MDTSPLFRGTRYWFKHWPAIDLPDVAAGVYTIWDDDLLVYTGMAGRQFTAETIAADRAAKLRGKGLRSRLSSHASGRRSGDQFCIYVGDRLVLPQLSACQRDEIAGGMTSFDALIRCYIHERLSFRFMQTPDAASARAIENAIRTGSLGSPPPVLNPRKSQDSPRPHQR